MRTKSCLVLLAALTLCRWSYAEETPYRVLLGSVPGADEIEAGNIKAGIRILEDQLKDGDPAKQGEVWSTLCAAFIINRSLIEAEGACNKAVATDPDYYALNNRGVLRVYKGDLAGARADFERVRPSDVEAYLEQLKAKDIRLVAASNFDLVGELLAMRRPQADKRWREVSTADVEPLTH